MFGIISDGATVTVTVAGLLVSTPSSAMNVKSSVPTKLASAVYVTSAEFGPVDVIDPNVPLCGSASVENVNESPSVSEAVKVITTGVTPTVKGAELSSATGGRPKIPVTSHRVARSWWMTSSLLPTTSPFMLISTASLNDPSGSVPKSCMPVVESQMKAWVSKRPPPTSISIDPTT